MDDRSEHEKAGSSTPDATPDGTGRRGTPGARRRRDAGGPRRRVRAGCRRRTRRRARTRTCPRCTRRCRTGRGCAVTAPGDELAARRARRAPRWLQVAAVVAGVAVIGGAQLRVRPEQRAGDGHGRAGDLAGRRRRRGTRRRRRSAPMADDAATSMAADAKLMYPWWGGRTVFTASGLSTEGGSGDAWGFDAAGTYSEATVGRGGCGARGVGAAAARVRHVDRRPERRLGCVGVAVAGRPREPVLLRPDAGPVELRAVGAGRASASRRRGPPRTCRG